MKSDAFKEDIKPLITEKDIKELKMLMEMASFLGTLSEAYTSLWPMFNMPNLIPKDRLEIEEEIKKNIINAIEKDKLKCYKLVMEKTKLIYNLGKPDEELDKLAYEIKKIMR